MLIRLILPSPTSLFTFSRETLFLYRRPHLSDLRWSVLKEWDGGCVCFTGMTKGKHEERMTVNRYHFPFRRHHSGPASVESIFLCSPEQPAADPQRTAFPLANGELSLCLTGDLLVVCFKFLMTPHNDGALYICLQAPNEMQRAQRRANGP